VQLPLLPLAKAYTPLALDNLRAKEQRLSAEKRVDDALTAQNDCAFSLCSDMGVCSYLPWWYMRLDLGEGETARTVF